MIFLVQFGINKHLQISSPQIALALQARAILLVFEKFTRAYLFQIALEITGLSIQICKFVSFLLPSSSWLLKLPDMIDGMIAEI